MQNNIIQNKKNLSDFFKNIKQNNIYHFLSNGNWNNAELLLYLLKITGKAKVYITTFSISEIAIRTISNAKKNNLISELNFLIDFTNQHNKLKLCFFAEEISDNFFISKNHTKLISIENNNWKIIVNGSANMNHNVRYETGFVSTDIKTFNIYKPYINEIFKNATKFL